MIQSVWERENDGNRKKLNEKGKCKETVYRTISCSLRENHDGGVVTAPATFYILTVFDSVSQGDDA